MATARVNITDRAHRYRANEMLSVVGKRCALCGSTRNLVVDHKDGHPDHTSPSNLQILCKSCNTAKGGKRPTNQYNPAKGEIPTFDQYAWAVSSGARQVYSGGSTRHAAGVHDEAGAIIHATPKRKRAEYAREIARRARSTRQVQSQERWNPSAAEVNREFAKENGKRRQMGLPALTKRDFVYQWYPELFKSNPWPFSRPDARQTTPARGGIAHHMAKRPAATGGRKKAAVKESAYLSAPDEETIQRGFKAGKTLNEILRGNPSRRGKLHKRPGHSQSDTAIWMRDKTVAAGLTVSQEWWDGNVYKLLYYGPAGEPLVASILPDGSWYAEQYSMPDSVNPSKRAETRGMFKMYPVGFLEDVASGSLGSSQIDRKLARQELIRRKKQLGKRNPAAASADVFEDFHGFKPSEVITITKRIHHHEELAAAGKLVSLDVWGIDERGHKISGFKGSFLAFNEDRNQLFVEGGDQSIDLKTYGITRPHELETLGELTDVAYQTDKTHLGDEGGEAVYVHKFRSTNENGKHVVVKIARYPDLIYDVRNEQLLFSGGSYEILREGIDK